METIPSPLYDIDSEPWNTSHVYQEDIKRLHKRIDTLNRRLEDTKRFADSLWEQLREYER